MADISPNVRALIAEHISSVAQLEIILLLRHAPDQSWSAEDLSQQLRTEPAWVTQVLRDLCARGFCEQSDEPSARFRFKPKNAEMGQMLNDLARDYLIHRVRITEMIYSRPSESIRAFTDAFNLRKGGGNG